MKLQDYLDAIKLATNKHILNGIYFNMMDNTNISISDSQIICIELGIKEQYLDYENSLLVRDLKSYFNNEQFSKSF